MNNLLCTILLNRWKREDAIRAHNAEVLRNFPTDAFRIVGRGDDYLIIEPIEEVG